MKTSAYSGTVVRLNLLYSLTCCTYFEFMIDKIYIAKTTVLSRSCSIDTYIYIYTGTYIYLYWFLVTVPTRRQPTTRDKDFIEASAYTFTLFLTLIYSSNSNTFL